MTKKEKLNGQTVACREASDILYGLLDGNIKFGYLSNQFASDDSKKAFRREIERISSNLANRESRLLTRLAAVIANDD